jgi:16S rRNA (guanine966-N2)-methyltransferase
MKPGRRASGGPRISAGRWKGRRLDVPAGARPPSGRAREALFDLLGPRIEGARVLDLYAGSGAVGLEAVSRGAVRAVLVEADAAALKRNLERLGSPPEISVVEGEAAGSLAALAARGEQFDVVFSDPPYAPAAARTKGRASGRTDPEPRQSGLPSLLRLLSPDAAFILQRDTDTPAPAFPGLTLVRERAYGRNVFAFYAPEGRDAARDAPGGSE